MGLLGMIKLIQLLTFTALLVLTSCVPQQSAGGKRKSSSSSATGGSTDNDTSTPNTPDFTSSEGSVYWYSGNQNLEQIMTINEDTQTVVYLRGEPVHNFLSTDSNNSFTYCLVLSYNSTDTEKNLRFRAVPLSFYNFTTSSQENLLRVDIPDETNNSSACAGNAYWVKTTVLNASSVGNSDSAFIPTGLCPTCRGTLSSTDASLYVSSSGITTNDRVPDASLDLSGIQLRVDTQSESSQETGSCSDAGCEAKGFDCCLDGQCVNDGQERPNASSETNYSQALIDVGVNPENFINWPNVYFVCGTRPDPVATPTPLPDASATANALLQEQIQEYLCLEEGKKEVPDFAGNNVCAPTYDQSAYETIRSSVWDKCGCEAAQFPTDPDDPICPDYGLKVNRDINDNIIEVLCDVPPPPADPTPFQNLSLPISARSAPHRFYREDTGESVDDLSTLDTTVKPEGTPFAYLDNSSKTDPVAGENNELSNEFNFNSITGQFNVELNQARPATVVNVDFDQTFIISTVSGYYSPCPLCASDSWFESFTAHPTSQLGAGLQAVGYTTNRSNFENNTPFGNYEDTHFGRACFLPPTMVPFSHQPNSDLNTQRKNRLTTQAALWVNGYQRDWFGFNKGALIGSFDGVSWFAIGKQRRVTATSNRLFLAMNQPYSDLADPTDLIVSVVIDLGNNTVPSVDYDPALSPDDINQNTGASCQYWHQCDTDTDCISKLGWEYMCIDTQHYRSSWPKFNSLAVEQQNNEYEEATFNRIITGIFPAGSKKRCVYRGSGSPCKRDPSSLNANNQKQFTCAPNFYCAELDGSEFNKEVVRTPNELEIFLFGQEANVLGRPFNYIGANNQLPSVAVNNLHYNFQIFSSGSATSEFGLCRPGKSLNSSSWANAHQNKDNTERTDYISQIGACDSETTNTDRRIQTCPIIQEEEDQAVAKGDLIFSFDSTIGHSQNQCGRESTRDNNGQIENSFALIESGPLKTLNSILSPTMTQDACLRRPGSVCHTDLDCGPNRLHAEQAIFFGKDYFGGTDAELEFWQQNLVCGQADEKPTIGADDFFEYDMAKNRCCREVGKDFTMYTQIPIADKAIDPDYNNNNEDLNVTAFPWEDPTATGRYSRYVVANPEDCTLGSGNCATADTVYAQAPNVQAGQVPRAFQWKTFNDTGSKTCCGGGWIRKFVDGTNDWTKRNRLNMNPYDLACLNYHSDIQDEKPDYVGGGDYSRDLDYLCLAPADGGCVQQEMIEPDGFSITPPSEITRDTATMSTRPLQPPAEGGVKGITLSMVTPYTPITFNNPVPINQDTTDTDGPYVFFKNPATYIGTSFYVPIYISHTGLAIGATNNIKSIKIKYVDADGNPVTSPMGEDMILHTDAANQYPGAFGCPNGAGGSNPVVNMGPYSTGSWVGGTDPDDYLNPQRYCFRNMGAFPNDNWVFHARAATPDEMVDYVNCTDDNTCGDDSTHNTADPDFENPFAWDHAWVEIEYTIQNTDNFIVSGGSSIAAIRGGDSNDDRRSLNPGNDLYYLTKLARFELLGIPQIFYEPLYCSSNRSKIVDGLFDVSPTKTAFRAVAFTANNSAVNGRDIGNIYDASSSTLDISNTLDEVVFQDEVALNQVFSSNEFRCCKMLGTEASTADQCCSNFLGDDGTGKKTCALPVGTNLNVYFNKFVSGEGIGDELPLGGLTDDDFIPETGEPKLNEDVYKKLDALGIQFCANASTRRGGSFGYFNGEPNAGYYQQEGDEGDQKRYSIVDSNKDSDNDNETGINEFLQGFRWDHQIYCN